MGVENERNREGGEGKTEGGKGIRGEEKEWVGRGLESVREVRGRGRKEGRRWMEERRKEMDGWKKEGRRWTEGRRKEMDGRKKEGDGRRKGETDGDEKNRPLIQMIQPNDIFPSPRKTSTVTFDAFLVLTHDSLKLAGYEVTEKQDEKRKRVNIIKKSCN